MDMFVLLSPVHPALFVSQYQHNKIKPAAVSYNALSTKECCNTIHTSPAFYGTRRFNTEFTRALNLSLS
jgi:hypothetical protein